MSESVDQKLLGKLEEIAARRDELEGQLADPAVASDPHRSIALAKEIGKLRFLVDPYRELKKTIRQLGEAREMMLDSGQDRELR